MKYTLLRETNGGFEPTGETFDAGELTGEDANAAAQARIEELQAENGGSYAAQIIEE